MVIDKVDERFLRMVMRKFGIHKLKVRFDNSLTVWPDCWVKLGAVPVISVTAEWARQLRQERQKRLLHEAMHCIGIEHGKKGKLTYSTRPAADSFSREMYKKLITNPDPIIAKHILLGADKKHEVKFPPDKTEWIDEANNLVLLGLLESMPTEPGSYMVRYRLTSRGIKLSKQIKEGK